MYKFSSSTVGDMLANLKSSTQLYAEEVAAIEAYLCQPRSPLPVFDIFIRQGRLEEGVAFLKSEVNRRADLYSARIYLAEFLIDRGRWEESFAIMRDVGGVKPVNSRDLRLYFFRAIFDLNANDAKKAAAQLVGYDCDRLQVVIKAFKVYGAREARSVMIRKFSATTPEVGGSDQQPVEIATGFVRYRLKDCNRRDVSSVEENLQPQETWGIDFSKIGGYTRTRSLQKVGWKFPEESPGDTAIATETLGDLYAQQGYYSRAKSVYRAVLGSDPQRQDLEEKIRKYADWVDVDDPVDGDSVAQNMESLDMIDEQIRYFRGLLRKLEEVPAGQRTEETNENLSGKWR